MKKFVSSFWVFTVMLFFPVVAYVANQPEQVNALSYWVSVIGAGLYGVAHTVAALPPTVSAKLPPWLVTFLNLVAANYRNSKNHNG